MAERLAAQIRAASNRNIFTPVGSPAAEKAGARRSRSRASLTNQARAETRQKTLSTVTEKAKGGLDKRAELYSHCSLATLYSRSAK